MVARSRYLEVVRRKLRQNPVVALLGTRQCGKTTLARQVCFKYADAPTVTKSMRVAMADLGLTRLSIVYPGARSYPLQERIEVVSIRELARLAETPVPRISPGPASKRKPGGGDRP